MNLKSACTPRKSVFDKNRRDVVLDLSDFLEDKIKADAFFEESYVTAGMRTLLEKTFDRLESGPARPGSTSRELSILHSARRTSSDARADLASFRKD